MGAMLQEGADGELKLPPKAGNATFTGLGEGWPSRGLGLPRRRFLRDMGAGAAAVPLLGALGKLLGGPAAEARQATAAFPTENPWPKYPAYRFALVCHRATDPLFVPTRLGAKDACALFGTSFTWNGSASGLVTEMVDAFEDALDNQVDGIGVCVVDPEAFNGLTNQALSSGIPVIAFNAQAPASSGNNAMAYIGQDHFAAGVALASRAVADLKPGETAAAMVGTPSSHTEQSRVSGAASVFKKSRVHLDQVVVGTDEARAARNIEAWYKAHRGARFIFASEDGGGAALARASKRLGLASKGVRAASFNVSSTVLQAVSKGVLAFTIDQQTYPQGFLAILELFLYNLSGGLISPFDVDTGHKFVTKENVGEYLGHRDTWEGTSTTPSVLPPPKRIRPSGASQQTGGPPGEWRGNR
jgi:simple sugar transport system substrate-binding protein